MAQQEYTKSFPAKKDGTLEVSLSYGDVVIKAWEKAEVYIKARGINKRDLEDLKMYQEGNTVSVDFKPESGNSSEVQFEIFVPNQFNTDIHTSGGDVVFKGTISGNLKASTAGGDIKMENVGGIIEMTTAGGDIITENIDGEGVITTSAGDIRVGMVKGTLKVSTAGGDIRVKSVGKTLKANTAAGDIEIGDIGGEASASTAGGDIRVGKVNGKATLSTAAGDIELSGATGTVKTSTAGGDLRLYGITGSIQGSTAAGDIYAEMYATGSGGSKLTTAGGKITLNISENCKVNIEAVIKIEHGWNQNVDEYKVYSDFKSDKYELDEHKKEIRATYILNGGGEKILLKTSNSDIEIRKLLK
jgi:hypothetical protein